MRIELASSYGFCFGVKRAIKIAENAKDAVTIGPIIHNNDEIIWVGLLVLGTFAGLAVFQSLSDYCLDSAAKNISTKSIYTTAPRGEIYDRNGKLLAGNKQSTQLLQLPVWKPLRVK